MSGSVFIRISQYRHLFMFMFYVNTLTIQMKRLLKFFLQEQIYSLMTHLCFYCERRKTQSPVKTL